MYDDYGDQRQKTATITTAAAKTQLKIIQKQLFPLHRNPKQTSYITHLSKSIYGNKQSTLQLGWSMLRE